MAKAGQLIHRVPSPNASRAPSEIARRADVPVRLTCQESIVEETFYLHVNYRFHNQMVMY